MNEEEFEEYYKRIEPNFNSKIEKGTIEMSNEYYNAVEERMVRLINKNNALQTRIETLEKGLEYAKRIEKDYKTKFDKVIKCLGIDEDILNTCEIYDVNGIEVYKILQGSDK